MANNQRENERIARKNAKSRKIQKIIWAFLIIIIAIIAAMKISEIDFKSLKNNFIDENGKFSISAFSDENKFPASIDSSSNAELCVIGNQIAVLNETSYSVIDSKNAQIQYRDVHGFANPVMKVSGDYAVIFDQGTNKYRLDTSAKNVYKDKSDNIILCADTSNSGVIVLATTSSKSKSEIVVYNKSLNEKMRYSVPYGYVTAIAIDDSSNRVAFAAVNSENAKLKTIVYTMSITDEKPRAEFIYNSSMVYDLHFASSNLYVVGSDFVSVISSLKNEIKVIEQDAYNIASFCYNPSDELVIAYSEYAGSNENKLAYIASSGNIKAQINADAFIKDITASKSKISVLTNDAIITYIASKGTEENRIEIDDSYSSIMQMSSNIFAKHQTLLERFS